MITAEEADRRVSGMQSAMAKQMDALRKEYEDKLSDLQVQLKTKDEELTKANGQVINLTQGLEKAENELQETVSAFKAKQKALDTLNANVNTPAEDYPTLQDGLAKCNTPAERVAFISSGKYTK